MSIQQKGIRFSYGSSYSQSPASNIKNVSFQTNYSYPQANLETKPVFNANFPIKT